MTADTPSSQARLHAALAAAAAAPVPDGWDAIREQLADPPLTLDLHLPPARRRSQVRLVSAAAGVLLLLAGAVTLLDRDDPSPPVVTGPADATGWYVPVGLPDGWRLLRVDHHSSPHCAEQGQRWVTGSGEGVVSITRKDCTGTSLDDGDDDAVIGSGATPVDLGRGINATRSMLETSGAPAELRLRWRDDAQWQVLGVGITTEQATAAGRAAVADPSLAFALAGFTRADGWDSPATEAAPDVGVDLLAPGGAQVGYVLTLPGTGIGRNARFVPRPVSLPGQDLPVVALGRVDDNWVRDRYAGAWPGADLTSYVSIDAAAQPDDPCTGTSALLGDAIAGAEAALRDLLAALRPASTDEWRAFLATAETAADPAVSQVADLAGLTEVPTPDVPPSEPPTTSPEPSGPVTCPPS